MPRWWDEQADAPIPLLLRDSKHIYGVRSILKDVVILGLLASKDLFSLFANLYHSFAEPVALLEITFAYKNSQDSPIEFIEALRFGRLN